MHGLSTPVMETEINYYIGAVGRSSGGVQFTVSGRQRRCSSSNYRATAACKESEGDQVTSRRNERTTGRWRHRPMCRRNIGIRIGLLLSKKSEHRTSAVIPESAKLYTASISTRSFIWITHYSRDSIKCILHLCSVYILHIRCGPIYPSLFREINGH